jgi:class 3 adenylate cyclase
MSEERKLVTILFADVTGSTSLGESLDPEDVRALMGRYYDHSREVIGSYGGTLEKFIGDAVMAVFGLPVSHGDDAERALAAALALREAVRRDEFLGASFQLRMGVNTGEVMATTDATRSDFLVTGDTVNVAARLQQHANPDEIVAGERTAQAARMAFTFEDVREVQVKGKQLPLRVFPLIEKRAIRQVERPPLVGRKQDLLQLEILRERALEEERPQLVTLIAPAGTGKTRLLEEFLNHLDAEQGFQVATARCLPYGQTLTYWPLQGLLRELLGAEVTKERVVACLVRAGYKADDAARLTDHVLTTLGIEGEGSGGIDRELIFSAWRLLIESLAREAPRIIIFEDLHWASDSLLDLVEHITHIRTQAAILLIALSRPELLDRRPNWGGGRQNFSSLSLQPLSTKQTGELIKRLAVDLPVEVCEQIIESSGGNPFFALELLRGLAERGLTGQSATAGALPDTVHAAVLARLDLLSKTEREVLQVASVASRTFSVALLLGVLAEYSADEMRVALDGLLLRDMLVPVPPGDTFTFRHILILDVTYGTLSRAERIRLHKAIAACLLEAAGEHVDEQVELLAYHYQKAVQLSRMSAVPPKLEIETERAIKFQVRAGELASHSGAFAEGRSYFLNAIALAGREEKIVLYEKLGSSLGWGWSEEEQEAYQKALELWREDADSQPLVAARLIRKMLLNDRRFSVLKRIPQEEILALWSEGQQLAEQSGDEDELWRLRAVELYMRRDLDDLDLEQLRAQEDDIQHLKQLAAEATEYFTRRKDWEFLSSLLDGYSSLQLRLGENEEALATIKRRLNLSGLSLRERNDAVGMLVFVSLIRGEYSTAIATMDETLQALRPGEPIEYFGNTLGVTLWILYLTGRWDEVPRFQQALGETWKRVQDLRGAWGLLVSGYLALLCIALAREDRVEINANEAMLRRLAPEIFKEDVLLMIAAYRDEDFSQTIASIANQDENNQEIMGLSMMVFTEHGLKPPDKLLMQDGYFHDDLTLRVFKIAQALRDDDNHALEQAIDEAEAHQLLPHAARLRIVLARLTGDRSQLERARPVLERLKDRLFLRKLGEVEEMLPQA